VCNKTLAFAVDIPVSASGGVAAPSPAPRRWGAQSVTEEALRTLFVRVHCGIVRSLVVVGGTGHRLGGGTAPLDPPLRRPCVYACVYIYIYMYIYIYIYTVYTYIEIFISLTALVKVRFPRMPLFTVHRALVCVVFVELHSILSYLLASVCQVFFPFLMPFTSATNSPTQIDTHAILRQLSSTYSQNIAICDVLRHLT